ncbi:hypothetical protein MRX96_043800 [Rhipicephalus microplus]
MMGTKEGIITILSFCCVVNSINITVYVFGSYRNINSKGAAYDVAFGVETSLNLISDFKMIGSLHRDETMVKTLNAFLILNTGTTLFCYVGHIAACKFASKYAYVLYYIYSFYVECKQAAALPPVIAPVAFVASTGGGNSRSPGVNGGPHQRIIGYDDEC